MILRKEILPCHCMRYVYDGRPTNLVMCHRHSEFYIDHEGRHSVVQLLLDELLQTPAYQPQPKNKYANFLKEIALFAVALTIGCSLPVGMYYLLTPKHSAFVADPRPHENRVLEYHDFDSQLTRYDPYRSLSISNKKGGGEVASPFELPRISNLAHKIE